MTKKYIDAEKLRAEIKSIINSDYPIEYNLMEKQAYNSALNDVINLINSLQQERQMPDSTQLIAEWEKEKAVLEQKDFRGDAERIAYNAFLDGFVKGLGYESTR